jgi:2-polyprenyl-3-methyl-5-hydroxy-6-metoxy-1,4-benzoquinol methylase
MCLNHQISEAFSEAHANAFAERLVDSLNEGALCLMLSIGHRTGLFDTMAKLPEATSNSIAAAAGLNERYVREWLGAMVTGRVVHYQPEQKTYHLPAEHASVLSRSSGENIAVFAQYIPVMGQVEDDIVNCFYQGGGLPYERYPRFHEIMAEDSGQTVLASLLDHILPLEPTLVDKLRQGIRVLDVGCGRGKALNLLAREFPNSKFTGMDLSAEAVAYANDEAAQHGLTNVRFEQQDVSDFDRTAEPEAYDLVFTFDAVHDQANPLRVLKGINKTLKPDGVYLMQDIHSSSEVQNNLDHPVGTLLYTISTMHCMSVSLGQNGEGLGTMWGREKAIELLHEAGFTRVDVHQLEHDFQNDYYIIRKK